jgi:hypothetical protein
VLAAAAGATLLGVFYPNTGHRQPETFSKGPVQLVAPLPESVPFAKGDRAAVEVVVGGFIESAVLRDHPERSYDLADVGLRQGMSRAEWRTGNIPIVPFPREQLQLVRWRLDYSFRDRVGLKVALQPRPRATVGGLVFNMELHAIGQGKGRHWLVDDWTPASPGGAAPSASSGRNGINLAPVAGAKPGASAAWLLIPVGLLFGGVVLFPLGLALRGWYSRSRAARARLG